jgi:hypothetical protein
MCLLGYSSEHKGCKCFHVPTNCLFISQDVVFDKTLFPFAALPSPASEPIPLYSSSVLPNKFVDVAHLPVLLSNHGAGLGHSDMVHALSLWRTRPR